MDKSSRIKIGQMIMAGIPGERVSDSFRELCREYSIGNFCISAENAVSLDILCDMNADIRKITYENTGIYPLISIDQEGGWVCRFYGGAAFMQGNMSHAAAGFDRGRMEAVGARLGRILRALGCNMNNAPVLDVNSSEGCPVIGTRSFGNDPEKVSELGCGFMRGLNESGVCAIVKHFPGHGNTEGDTHLVTSRNRSDMETFRKNDLHPFKCAFENGAGALMTAHVTYDAYGGEPATATKSIMTGLLRDELGFDGIAVTDSMNIYRAVDRVEGYPVRSIYSVDDLPDYESYDYRECPYCKRGRRLDALVNSFGFSAI